MFWSSLHLMYAPFLTLRRIQWDTFTNVHRSPCQVPYSRHISMKLEMSWQNFKKSSNTNFYNNPFSGSQFALRGQTDGHTWRSQKPLVVILWICLKMTTDIPTGTPRTHKSVYPICTKFVGLVPKPPCHNLLPIIVWMNIRPSTACHSSPMAIKSHTNKPRHMQDVWAAPIPRHSPSPELCTLCGDGHCCAAGWCLQWVHHVCSWSRYADLGPSDSMHCVITQSAVQK
jgi:hypothetical protein